MAAMVVPLGCLSRARTASCLVPLRVELGAAFFGFNADFALFLALACLVFEVLLRGILIPFRWDGIKRRHHRSPTVAGSPAGQDL
jgi:hypothetical protein